MTCHLLSYGGVASPVAVRARAQLLKEADSRSNRVGSRRGAVWSARAARARSAFWASGFGDAEAAAAASLYIWTLKDYRICQAGSRSDQIPVQAVQVSVETGELAAQRYEYRQLKATWLHEDPTDKPLRKPSEKLAVSPIVISAYSKAALYSK